MAIMKRKRGPRERKGPKPGMRARQYLLDHPHETNKAVAEATQVGERTVGYARKALVDSEKVSAEYFSRTANAKTQSLKANPHPASGSAGDKAHEALKFDGKNLSTEESLEMLTQLARDGFEGGNFAQAKGSIETHEKLKARSAVSTLGPPDPQTDKEKIDRLAVIIDVCGPILAASAVLKAFWEAPERTLFFGEFERQQSTRALGTNPWGQTATNSPPITTEDLLDGESNEDQEGPAVAEEHAEDAPNDIEGDPLD